MATYPKYVPIAVETLDAFSRPETSPEPYAAYATTTRIRTRNESEPFGRTEINYVQVAPKAKNVPTALPYFLKSEDL